MVKVFCALCNMCDGDGHHTGMRAGTGGPEGAPRGGQWHWVPPAGEGVPPAPVGVGFFSGGTPRA